MLDKVTIEADVNVRKCMQIQNCINDYLSKHPKQSIYNVEIKTTVSDTTLRRILALKGNPKAEIVIKIFRSLGQDELLFKYMKEFHPEIAKVMTTSFSHNQDYEFVNDKDCQYFTNENYFLILSLACTSAGTTEDEISFELGRKGIERLEELVTNGLIVKTSDNRYIGSSKKYKLSFADTKERIRLALKHYRLEEAGGINNWESFQTESTNVEGLKALKKLNQKHFKEREEQIFYNPMYNGDIKVYSASISSTFLSYPEKGELHD